MNARSTVGGLGAATVPGALVVGVALVAGSMAGLRAQRDHYRAEAANPRPTTTVTAPAVRPAPGSTSAVTRPSPTPTPTPAATVVAVSEKQALLPHTSDGGLSHAQARPPSAPQPTPAPTRAAPSCSGSVTVRLPLGVLPRCALTAGGNR